jgi:hypothetical protein
MWYKIIKLFNFGKDPVKRYSDELVKKVNSSVFQISKNGKYDLNATFCLKSSLPTEKDIKFSHE